MKGTGRVPAHDVPLVYVRSLWAHSARRECFFGKGAVHAVQTAPPPVAPPTGFGTYISLALKTSMVRPGRGATSNSGRGLTPGCYALKQKYHLPPPPPPRLVSIFVLQHTFFEVISAMRQSFYAIYAVV